MPNQDYPLLIFPNRARVERNKQGGGAGKKIKFPSFDRQLERLAPQFAELNRAFEAKRLAIDGAAPVQNPELVLVLEVIGSVEDFYRAVSNVPQLEWLLELAEDEIDPDDDFRFQDAGYRQKPLAGRLYLLGSNQDALQQLLSLWNRFKRDRNAKFDRGLTPFKHVFAHLKEIRPWDERDRIDDDMRDYWQNEVERGDEIVRFEIEAWYFAAQAKNDATALELRDAAHALGGRILQSALIPEIGYHGFLVGLPAAAIQSILGGDVPQLLLSDRVMFFRPKAQSVTDGASDAEPIPAPGLAAGSELPPVVALLDGLPLANHGLLQNRLVIDDPDGWEATYEVKDRVHGTAMASLILHGELDGATETLQRKLYVRPILKPNPTDIRDRREEHTPDDLLLLDLIHRAVKRICEGDGDGSAAAPTVKVVNLSVGLSNRVFARTMSPWARLLDWLAHRFSLLFIVSAGNDASSLTLAVQRDALAGMSARERADAAFSALVSNSASRRILSPAESINALTIGAYHADNSRPQIPGTRYDLFSANGVSPISRIGLGYRRSIKPDLLMPGGRLLFSQSLGTPPDECIVDTTNAPVAPGHRVAVPPMPGPGRGMTETGYTRGTSNAAALASRAAAQAYDVLESLRHEHRADLPTRYDAVLLKAMLVHGAQWGDLPKRLLDERPDFQDIAHGASRKQAEQDFVTRWLGYGVVDIERSISCAPHRVTLIGVGEVGADEALAFSAPLPPGLSGRVTWRRITITLAWMSPAKPTQQRYRQAKLWIKPPDDTFQVVRTNSVNDRAAQRGTVQHEILEGEAALAFVDGADFVCKVNCMADAGPLQEKVRFALCISLEVGVESGIDVYQEVRERIAPPVPVRV
jgi:Subtilase family